MRAELISIGTELLLGQTLNSNVKYLAEECAMLGINVYYQTVVGDNLDRIQEVLELAKKRADLIICTGGLGPTQDDLTKEALAAFTNRKICIHQPALEKIKRVFEARGAVMVANNERQAYMIEGAHLLANDSGLAIGLALTDDGTHYMLLPGPPRELKPMFANHAVPWLDSIMEEKSALHSKTLRFAGIVESELDNVLKDILEQQQDPTIAPYAKVGEVSLRLTTRAESREAAEAKFQDVERKIRERTEPFLYADEDIPLEQAVFARLKERGATMSVAESCTGGLLSHLMTAIPGSSSVFRGGVICYTNEVKNKFVGVPMEQLEGEDVPGAVSAETAEQLALNVRTEMDADYSLAVTGVAGPQGSEGKPVGLVYIGVSERGGETKAVKMHFPGDRNTVQLRAAKYALYLLHQLLK